MKRLSYGLLCVLVLLLPSCEKEGQEETWDGPVIELSVSCVEPTNPTKAGVSGVEAGENPYHENDIAWVDFFFYPGEATSEPATYHVRKTSGKRENDVFRIELTTNQVNSRIFPAQSETTTATVFAIANGPRELLDGLEDTSLDNIGRQTVSTEFVNVSHINHRQDNFMMSGRTQLTLTGRSKKVVSQGLVGLSRYAGKITVGIKMDDRVEVDTGRKDAEDNPVYEVWKPRPKEMQIYLVDGVNKVALDGSIAGVGATVVPQESNEGSDYLSYRGNPMRFYNNAGELYFDKEGEYYQTFPMYTYPYHWEPGSIEVGSREPYLKLVLPWDREADAEHNITPTQKEFYYKILIPQDSRGGEFLNSFVRNNWYHYDIGVGVLGSDTDEAEVTLDASLFIVYWRDKDVIVKHANIGNARYLSVEKEVYKLYNQNSVDVRYTTSNPVKIKNIRVTRPYYGEDPTVDQEKYGATVKQADNGSWYLEYSEEQRKALNGGEDWLQDVGGVIRFTHVLNNNYTSSDIDYSPYTITFSLGHKDNTQTWMDEYDKHVTIIQHPGIYIQATPNPDTWTGTTPDHWGYVYVNNDQYTRARYDKDIKDVSVEDKAAWELDHIWRVVHYSSGGTDMFRIDVSVLPTETVDNFDFVLGDPRQSTPINLREGLEEPYATAPAIEGGPPRSLNWYYPTEDSERTRHMLAPAYRVSTKLSGSEYGGTPLEQARMRCASLQENGFPAGRWRVPTEAEIRFISNLSAHGVFEWQFSGDYWSANGAVNVNTSTKKVTRTNKTVALLRCVYDSWYWGDDRVVNDGEGNPTMVSDGSGTPDIFIWGDRER